MENKKLSKSAKIWKSIDSYLFQKEEFAINFSEKNSSIAADWYVAKKPNAITLWRKVYPRLNKLCVDHSYIWTNFFTDEEWTEFKNEKFKDLVQRFEVRGQVFTKFENKNDSRILYECDLDNKVKCHLYLFDKEYGGYRGIGLAFYNCDFKDEFKIKSLSNWIAFFSLILREIVEELDVNNKAEGHMPSFNIFLEDDGDSAVSNNATFCENWFCENCNNIVNAEVTTDASSEPEQVIDISLNNKVETSFFGIMKFHCPKTLEYLTECIPNEGNTIKSYPELPSIIYNSIFQPFDSESYCIRSFTMPSKNTDDLVTVEFKKKVSDSGYETISKETLNLEDISNTLLDNTEVPKNYLEFSLAAEGVPFENEKYDRDYLISKLEEKGLIYKDVQEGKYDKYADIVDFIIFECKRHMLDKGIYCALFDVRTNNSIANYCRVGIDGVFDIKKLGVLNRKIFFGGKALDLPFVGKDAGFFTYDGKIIANNSVFSGDVDSIDEFQFIVFRVDECGDFAESFNLMSDFDTQVSSIRPEFTNELKNLLKKYGL